MSQLSPEPTVDVRTTPDGTLIRSVPDWPRAAPRHRRWPGAGLVTALAVLAAVVVAGGVGLWVRSGETPSPVELAAVAATVLALVGVVPQLVRLVRIGDASGVSLSAATIGATTEVGWIVYTLDARLWSAVPEAVLMVATNIVLAVAIRRHRTPIGRPLLAAGSWAVVLAAVTTTGGPATLGALLPLAYAVQVVPAVWTAYRTWSPRGVSGARWVLIGIESALWATYAIAHGDRALGLLGGIGMVAAAAILVRKRTTRHRDAPAPTALRGRRIAPGRVAAATEPAIA